MQQKEISKSVLKRLPIYLSYLKAQGTDVENISATTLAAALSLGEVQVRKDLAMISDGGRPKIGYNRLNLIDDIEQFLGYDNTNDAVLMHCIINLVGNVVLFLPPGWLLPHIWVRFRNFFRFFFTCLAAILLAEITQLLTLLGSFDIDDVILNMAALVKRLTHRIVALARVGSIPTSRPIGV